MMTTVRMELSNTRRRMWGGKKAGGGGSTRNLQKLTLSANESYKLGYLLLSVWFR